MFDHVDDVLRIEQGKVLIPDEMLLITATPQDSLINMCNEYGFNISRFNKSIKIKHTI